jgi:hypothetical protein
MAQNRSEFIFAVSYQFTVYCLPFTAHCLLITAH